MIKDILKIILINNQIIYLNLNIKINLISLFKLIIVYIFEFFQKLHIKH